MRRKKQKTLIEIEKETFLPFWLIATAVVSIIIHNLFYALTARMEMTFLLLSIILVAAFYVSVVYNIITYLNRKKPKDIWKMGWLGVLGILSIFIPAMITFYGFFALFGLKKDK